VIAYHLGKNLLRIMNRYGREARVNHQVGRTPQLLRLLNRLLNLLLNRLLLGALAHDLFLRN
jgi:hypothetical protein